MRKGELVFATKYSDGEPFDGWAVGFYDGILPKSSGDRFLVVDDDGKQMRGNGYRKVVKIKSEEIAREIIKHCKQFDKIPWINGINLWDQINRINCEDK